MRINRIAEAVKEKMAAVKNAFVFSKHADCEGYGDITFPVVVVYKEHEEYPGKIVGAVYEEDMRNTQMIVKDTAEEIAELMGAAGYRFIPRCKSDGPTIVGTWVQEEKLCS